MLLRRKAPGSQLQNDTAEVWTNSGVREAFTAAVVSLRVTSFHSEEEKASAWSWLPHSELHSVSCSMSNLIHFSFYIDETPSSNLDGFVSASVNTGRTEPLLAPIVL